MSMSQNVHERARQLITLHAAPDERWLQAHLHECICCRTYADAAGRVIQGVRSQPFAADSALVRTTQDRLRVRAAELRQNQLRAWTVCLSCLLVGLSTAVTTPLLWQFFEWAGVRARVPNSVWETGFTLFWIVPALVVSMALLIKGAQLVEKGETRWT